MFLQAGTTRTLGENPGSKRTDGEERQGPGRGAPEVMGKQRPSDQNEPKQRNCSPRRPGHRGQADSVSHTTRLQGQAALQTIFPRLGLHSLGTLPHVSHEFRPFKLVMWK